MVETSDLIPIIAGSLGGLIFLLIILALGIYFCCGAKRKRADEKKKFNRLYSNQESAPSQPSTLNKEKDPKLPKVNSSGLWVSSSLYAGTPADAYYIGNADPKHPKEHSSSNHKDGGPSKNHAKKIPPPVPQKRLSAPDPRMIDPYMAYQNNLRIYHSQQLAPLAEDGLYSAYDYSREKYPVVYGYENDIPRHHVNGHAPDFYEARVQRQPQGGKDIRLKRSQSDNAHTRDKVEKKVRKTSGPKAKRHSKTNSEGRDRSGSHASSKKSDKDHKEHRHSSHSANMPDVHVFSSNNEPDIYRQPVNSAINKSYPEVILRSKENLSKSVDELHKTTDNITDDEKKRFITKSSDDITAEINLRPYVYKGDLDKPANNKRKSDHAYENPLIDTMEQMIEEKANRRDPETGGPQSVLSSPSPSMPSAVTSYATSYNKRQLSVDIPDSARPDSPASVAMSSASGDMSNQGKHVTTDAFKFLDEYDDAVDTTDAGDVLTDTNDDKRKSPVSNTFMY